MTSLKYNLKLTNLKNENLEQFFHLLLPQILKQNNQLLKV
jgi:hypothetical protein